MKTVKEILSEVAPFLSFSEISSAYLNKGRSWLSNKVNETEINGVKYHLNRKEVDELSGILSDLSQKITDASKRLKDYSNRLKRQEGAYFTRNNPFNHPLFIEWFNQIEERTTVVEPFAGSCNIPLLLKDIGIEPKWKCYDITPLQDTDYHVTKHDSISNMPQGKVIITNPPYLAMNSAKRRGLNYPNTSYQDVYLYCIEQMLNKAKYVSAIIPESFITSNKFHERLYGIVSLNQDCFIDTKCPVCLALFNPKTSDTFKIYSSEDYIGDYKTIVNNVPFKVPNAKIDWKTNVPSGSIGVQCIDGKHNYIHFLEGESIEEERIVESSRSYTRIAGLPDNIDRDKFISLCNDILEEYRKKTHDILLTSFKGKRADGYYRRRIDFATVKAIMDTALNRLEQNA